jgi:curli production assembly/transport component CsgG
MFDGDYSNSNIDFGGQIGFKQYLMSSYFSVGVSAGYITLSNSEVFKDNFIVADANFEYNILPYDNLTPFIYLGGGGLTDENFNDITFKVQYGLGLEYIPLNNIGLRIFAEQNFLLSDELDGKVHGDYYDKYWTFGLGVNLFLGK